MRHWVMVCALAATLGIGSAVAQPKQLVQAELIADVDSVAPNSAFRLGILFKIPPRAHIYWRFPGSSGLATGIEWTLPDGLTIDDLQWPTPSRFEIREIDDVTYAYPHEVLLFAKVSTPATLDPSQEITLKADPYWLICLESGQCIPEGAELELTLSTGPAKPSPDAHIFETYQARLPVTLDDRIPLSLNTGNARRGIVTITATPPWRFALHGTEAPPRLFPDEGEPWDLKPTPERPGQTDSLSFVRTRETTADGESPPVSGVLVLPMLNTDTKEQKTHRIRLEK